MGRGVILLTFTYEGIRYTHDCTQCVFLGTMGRFDLYVHTLEGSLTYVARSGEGAEYVSGVDVSRDKYLLEASKRAEDLFVSLTGVIG